MAEDSKMAEDSIGLLAEAVAQHMMEECMDGDAIVLTKQDLVKRFASEVTSHYEMKIVEEREDFIHLSDMSNENVIITSNREIYDRQPSWVFLKIEFFAGH